MTWYQSPNTADIVQGKELYIKAGDMKTSFNHMHKVHGMAKV